MAKNIYAVSMVKNESDIIESFCRYTLTFCDGMVICDDNSVDGTKEIIRNLIDENLNITLLDNTNTFGHYQSEITTSLAQIAANDFNADLILPLDADEFLIHIDNTSNPSPRKILGNIPDNDIKTASWINCLPSEAARSNDVFLPAYFNRLFNLGNGRGKAIIGAKLIKERSAVIHQGNHFIRFPNSGEELVGKNDINLYLLHYPIRSIEQTMAKGIVGWANTLCVPGRKDSKIGASHWGSIHDEVRENGMLEFDKLIDFTKRYLEDEADIIYKDIPTEQITFNPGITLRYTDYRKSQKNLWKIILSNYEHIIEVFMGKLNAKGPVGNNL